MKVHTLHYYLSINEGDIGFKKILHNINKGTEYVGLLLQEPHNPRLLTIG